MNCTICKKYIRNDAWKTGHPAKKERIHLKCANKKKYPWTIAVRTTNGYTECMTRQKHEQAKDNHATPNST